MAYTSPVKLGATVEELPLEATGDVDRGLTEWSLGLSLGERLRAASKSARTLDRLQRGVCKDCPARTRFPRAPSFARELP
jgi:hypothetical protein